MAHDYRSRSARLQARILMWRARMLPMQSAQPSRPSVANVAPPAAAVEAPQPSPEPGNPGSCCMSRSRVLGATYCRVPVRYAVHDRTTRGGQCHAEATAVNDRHQPVLAGNAGDFEDWLRTVLVPATRDHRPEMLKRASAVRRFVPVLSPQGLPGPATGAIGSFASARVRPAPLASIVAGKRPGSLLRRRHRPVTRLAEIALADGQLPRIACERHWRRKRSSAEGGSPCLG